MKFKYYFLSLSFMLFFMAFLGSSTLNAENNTPVSSSNNETTDKLIMSFLTHANIALGTVEQEDQLSVLISTDFNGKFTDRNIRRANWEDITDRFELSPVTEGDEFLATQADISDLVKNNDSFYIAFKYDTPAQTRDKRYVRWRVRNFNVVGVSNGDTTNLVEREPLTLHFKGPKEEGRTVASRNQVIFRGNLKRANFSYPTEDWAISAKIIVPKK